VSFIPSVTNKPIMLIVIMLSVVRLSVVAPVQHLFMLHFIDGSLTLHTQILDYGNVCREKVRLLSFVYKFGRVAFPVLLASP
jgi:hypothetical protein